MLRLIPAPIHRALMPLAHAVRHHWRSWRKAPIYGCSIIITDFEGSLLMLRHSYGNGHWSLPGGGIGRSERPEDAARREVREELGIDLSRLTSLGTVENEISGSPHTSHLFEAIADSNPQPDRREVVEARFFPTHSLPEPQTACTRQYIEIWQENRS